MKKLPALLALAAAVAVAAAPALADAQAAQPGAGPAAAPAPNGGKGKVLETVDAANYTYVKVELGGVPVWAAAPKFKVKKGDTVVVPAGSPMPGFHSKTLNRTFDLIYFVGSVQVVDPKAKS